MRHIASHCFSTKNADSVDNSVDEEIIEATNLVKKKNAKSIVWNYFGLRGDKMELH